MKILQLRKFFFLNITAGLSVFFWRAFYIFFTKGLPTGIDNTVASESLSYFVNIFAWSLAVLFAFLLAIIEILIRLFIVNKHFHLNFTFRTSKFLDILYYIIFFTGLILSVFPILFALLSIFEALS